MLAINNLTPKVLITCTFFLLFLPFFQSFVHYFDEKRPLDGVYEKVAKPEMNPLEWETGNYQRNFEKWYNQQFGFRNSLVRINNQIDFSIFSRVSSPFVVLGKERYLYEASYIKTFNGEDFVGEAIIGEKLTKLKAVRDTLNKLGKDILIVIAPSKAAYYPEYIPDELNHKAEITNRQAYVAKMASMQLPYLDLAQWTYDLKGKIEYPLFPKTGLHWTNYMADLAADSMIRFIEKWKGIDLPEFRIVSTTLSDSLIDPDNDVERGLNLLYKIPNTKYGYNQIEVQGPEKNQHRILVIGDSFYWQIFNRWISRDVFKDGKFWYYNKQVYPETWWGPEVQVEKLDFKAEINDREAFVLFFTEQNMSDMGWGFIEKLHDLYYPH